MDFKQNEKNEKQRIELEWIQKINTTGLPFHDRRARHFRRHQPKFIRSFSCHWKNDTHLSNRANK